MTAAGRLELGDRAADAARADDIVITIGTPSFSHVESDLSQVRAAVDDLLPLLRPGHALILRSTIAPGTTEFVPKESFMTRVGGQGCGVGYYK